MKTLIKVLIVCSIILLPALVAAQENLDEIRLELEALKKQLPEILNKETSLENKQVYVGKIIALREKILSLEDEKGEDDKPSPKIAVAVIEAVQKDEGVAKSPQDPVAEKGNQPGKAVQYVYVLTEIKVKEITWSDGAMNGQTEHKPNQPGYLQRTKSPIHTQIEMVRCIDCPDRIVLGKSIHFKLDARTRYDTEEYRCNGTPGDRWPPSLSITTNKGLFEANTKGKALHFPNCKELGVTEREVKVEGMIPMSVIDPVGLTLDESVSLAADFRFTGDATDYDAVFYNNPAFNYSAKYSSDGKLSRETSEDKITVEYSNTKLKTPAYLMSNVIGFHFNGLSLIYTLQVKGEPKPINIVPFEVPSEFDKPPLGGTRVVGKEDVETIEESQSGEDVIEADGKGDQTGSDAKSRSETAGKTSSSQTQQDKEISGQSVTAEVDPNKPESIDPNHPKIKGLINEWIGKAEPIANASGADLRFDKWGRVEGRAVGGIITLHGKPDDVAGRAPEKYVWDIRDKLDSVDHCTLGEYVTAKLGDKSLDHCTGRYKPKVSDVAGMSKKQAEEKLKGLGLKTKVTLGSPGGDREGDKGDINIPELTEKLRQIIKTSKEADSLLKNQQVEVKLAASLDLCDQAGSVRQEMPGRADSIEKTAKLVNLKLSMASDLAKKCPDVNNPQNITRKYEFAKQLTPKIKAKVDRLKRDSAAVVEKISLAKIARADALKEAEELKSTIAEKLNLAKPIWDSIKKYEQYYSAQPALDLYDLFPEGHKAMVNLITLNDASQALFDEANRRPQCDARPADDIVARAENAYTGALGNFIAAKNLPEEAEACLARAPAPDDKGLLSVPFVEGQPIKPAVETIANAGFKPQVELGSETADTKKINTIESQTPAKAGKGDDVFLKVYRAASAVCNEPAEKWNSVSKKCEAQKVALPDVAGKTYKEAVRLIKQAGLVPLPPALGKPAKDPGMVGRVEFALPAVDGQLHAGDGVTPYLYGEAVEIGNVPNVIGLGLREAMDVVKLAGFNPVIEVGKETADSDKEGTIYNQGPRPGYSLEPGRDVILEVYIQSIATTPVPRITGMSQRRARQTLKNVGLFVNLNKGKVAPTSSDQDKVYKQYPKPGFEVMSGVGIDIWVYGEAEEPEQKTVIADTNKKERNTNGLPFLDVPELPGYGYGPTTSYSCDGIVNFKRGTKFVRIQRSKHGFHCEGSSKKSRNITVNLINESYSRSALIKVSWYEPGDIRGDYKSGDGRISYSRRQEVDIISGKSDIARVGSKLSCVWVYISANLKNDISEYDAKRILSEYVEKLMSQVVPYAAKCR